MELKVKSRHGRGDELWIFPAEPEGVLSGPVETPGGGLVEVVGRAILVRDVSVELVDRVKTDPEAARRLVVHRVDGARSFILTEGLKGTLYDGFNNVNWPHRGHELLVPSFNEFVPYTDPEYTETE